MVKRTEANVNEVQVKPQPVKQCIEAVEAQYYEGDLLPEHASNPLISALGPYWRIEDIVRELSVPIPFSQEERCRSKEYRTNAVARLGNLIVGLPSQVEVVSTVHLLIRQHYSQQSIHKNGIDGIKERYGVSADGQLTAVYPHERSHAYCAGLFGISGSGKTTVLHSALRLLPKVIHHSRYGVTQVVRIKIDCPRSASLKDTLRLLLATYDDLLGTHYEKEVGSRATVADFANKVHRVARRHFTGLIVLDEIQNALYAVASHDPLFDFFVNFTNVVQVPVLVAGTPRAERLFRRTLRLARRASSGGVINWKGITNERDWDRFCKELSKYQWLSKAAPLSAAERKCLWGLTQGLAGLAVPLFQLAQYAAIASGEERLSARMFVRVFDEKMSAMKPIIRAIRSGKKVAMMKYDDVLGDTLKDVVAEMKTEMQHNLFYDESIRHDRLETSLDAVSSLMLIGIPRETASSMTALVQKHHPNASREQLIHEVCVKYYGTKSSALSRKSSSTSDEEASVIG
ncbi:ATP-binding protein [Burkholderia pyrrocinia]|uniref:ATP-binding protein n=1 Tax=Burkholderia pyrrocinia TaxID=60550 RepID=UPI001FC8DDF0|nr:ATP-binding protein [Burkholderia pyrrocinia]